jgi:tRNA threonylcarbamoyladenosine biosynthesis protein TsaB
VKILAFDTATRATSAAVTDSSSGLELGARDEPERGERPRHTTQLMALIADLMDRAGWAWPDIDRIAVGVGPGTFTGLRIGVSTARALARARGIELVGVSTLRSLALGAAADAAPRTCDATVAVLDARRAEVFAAAWRPGTAAGITAAEPVLGPVAISPSALAQITDGLGTARMAVGEGALAFREVLERSGTVIPGDRSRLHLVNAICHCRLAEAAAPTNVDRVAPQYLRLTDAELSLQAAQQR